MAKYNVEVVETLSRVVEVNAKNYESACEKVEYMYDKEDIILSYEDKENVNFKPYPSQNLKNSFLLQVLYDKEQKQLLIGTDKIPVQKSNAKTKDDLLSFIKTFIDNHIELEKVKPERNVSRER